VKKETEDGRRIVNDECPISNVEYRSDEKDKVKGKRKKGKAKWDLM
jgi:hypothetical protein